MVGARAYGSITQADSWEVIWEAGPYYERISRLLEEAEDFAIFAGWQIDSRLHFELPRSETLKEKILRVCEEKPDFQVYLLMWDHAYLYVFDREPLQGRIWDEIHPRVHFVFDNSHPFGSAHHEKLVVFDGRTALCGGMDLCSERWDRPEHLFRDPRRRARPYHDLTVQVSGPVVGTIQAHIRDRWTRTSSIPFPSLKREPLRSVEAGHRIYVSRSGASSPIVREIEFLFRDLILSARERIILEGQYYWSPTINGFLIQKLAEMRHRDFELILILADIGRLDSLARLMASWELRLLDQVVEAARASGTRLIMGCPYVFPPARGDLAALPPMPVYIHSKTIVIDDRFLSVGSANMAERALRVDTELSLTWEAGSAPERAKIRDFSRKLLEHWNIPGTPERHVRLRPFLPRVELAHMRRARPVASRIPWQTLLDPRLPLFYRAKRRFQVLLAHGSPKLLLAALASAIAGYLLGRASAETGFSHEPVFYGTLLAFAWLIPVPIFGICLLATLHLGESEGLRVSLMGYWLTAILCYGLGRFLPAATEVFLERTSAESAETLAGVARRLRRRRFQDLILTLFSPGIALRTKVLLQGINGVYSPWFGLGTLLIGASAISVACKVIDGLAGPPLRRGGATDALPFLAVAWTVLNLRPILLKLWK